MTLKEMLNIPLSLKAQCLLVPFTRRPLSSDPSILCCILPTAFPTLPGQYASQTVPSLRCHVVSVTGLPGAVSFRSRDRIHWHPGLPLPAISRQYI